MAREKKQREKLWEEATGHCIYCGKPLRLEEMEIDHIIPLCKGGDNSYGNKVCSCPGCNALKAGMSLEEFLQDNMSEKQRNRFSNRVNTLVEQRKMNWEKADLLDPYTTETFDGDWDEIDDTEAPVLKSLHLSGEMCLEFW